MTGGKTDMRRGGVIWITGLSGTGKSLLAVRVVERLRARSDSAILLDGDTLREILGVRGMDARTREQLALRYSRLAWLIAGQGFTVVVATISLRHSVHASNRKQDGHYLEVLLQTAEVLRRGRSSDGKGGPRVGIEIDAEIPLAPHLKLINDDNVDTLDELAIRIVDDYGVPE